MINLTQEQAINIVLNYDGIVAKEIYEPMELFLAKYQNQIGKTWSLGAVEGIITDVQYFPKAEHPNGIIKFKLPYEIKLIKKKGR